MGCGPPRVTWLRCSLLFALVTLRKALPPLPRLSRCARAPALDHTKPEESAGSVEAGQQARHAARCLATRVIDLEVEALKQPHASLKEGILLHRLALRLATEPNTAVDARVERMHSHRLRWRSRIARRGSEDAGYA